MIKEQVEKTICWDEICNIQLGVFCALCSGLIPAAREETDLGENFSVHMVQPCQTLCCGIWQHTGTSGCLATSSLALRSGTDTWYPVGRGLHHLCQLSVKARAGEMSPKFYSQDRLSFCLSTSWIRCSLLDLSATVHCTHHCGKLWKALSLLHHCCTFCMLPCLHHFSTNCSYARLTCAGTEEAACLLRWDEKERRIQNS